MSSQKHQTFKQAFAKFSCFFDGDVELFHKSLASPERGSSRAVNTLMLKLLYFVAYCYLFCTRTIYLEGSNSKYKFLRRIRIGLSRAYLAHKMNSIEGFNTIHDFIHYSDNVKTSNRLVKFVHGSPICFFKFPWCYLILIRPKYRLFGLAHGGGYCEMKVNLLEDFERDISDEFFGWGLCFKNLICTRFVGKKKHKANLQLKPSALVYPIVNLERLELLSIISPDAYSIIDSLVKSEFNVLNDINLPVYFKKHPKNCIYRSGKFNFVSSYHSSSVALILHPFSTAFYESIYVNRPFVLFFDRSWLSFFSGTFIDLLEFCHKSNVLFFYDELNELNYYLQENSLSSCIENNLKVKNFIESHCE